MRKNTLNPKLKGAAGETPWKSLEKEIFASSSLEDEKKKWGILKVAFSKLWLKQWFNFKSIKQQQKGYLIHFCLKYLMLIG